MSIRCNKATGSRDCNTALTGHVCMVVKRGYAGTDIDFCSSPLGEWCSCDPNLTSTESCQTGLSCTPQCLKMLKKQMCKYQCSPGGISQNCTNANRLWTMVYQNDENGIPLNNANITVLAEAIMQGAEVKVSHPKFGNMNIEKATKHWNEDNELNVYGQVMAWSRPPATSTIYFVFSTEGNIHATEFTIGDTVPKESRNNVNFGGSMNWFVRYTYMPVTHETMLARAIQDGASIRISRNNEEFMELDAVSYLPIEGLTLRELADILHGREFNVTEQFVFRNVKYTSNVTESSYKVNTHEKHKCASTVEQVGWFVDTCWAPVYRHDAVGKSEFGKIGDLIATIEAGKRIKVRVDGKLYQTSLVQVCGGVVTAKVYDSQNPDISNATWHWIIASSSGAVSIVDTPVGTNDTSASDTTKDVTWFADARDWVLGAVINATGAVLDNTIKTDLLTAFDAGADFRYMVQVGTGAGACQLYYEADQVSKLGTTDLRVYHDREILQETGGLWIQRYSFLTTSGTFYTDDYVVENKSKVASSTSQVDSVWFIGR